MSATHEDALQASRAVMKRALTEIAYWAAPSRATKIAMAALAAEHDAYAAGVRKAID